ncbi:Phage terminase large subunit [uncultured Anaerotruncus sp.]|uniref:Phage terminase large subunit n=1 Tax=uncultured Anaerotruncus sp. TaxID=905011 RepID=A0A6N2R7A8_9FIRM|nr:MAG TPA: large terminase [Caudoviricetes sp.]
MAAVKLSKVIAPSFAGVHSDIKKHGHTHYWLKGGRGSAKSSFISVEIVLGIMRDAGNGLHTNAVVLRRYGVTLRESVFEQIGWAVNALGVSQLWRDSVSPMSYTYLPTGQKILFRGVDDPTKAKSIKFSKGWAKYLWYEECVEFEGEEKLRNINQSVLRGGADFFVFYSFNPPKSARNWVNQYVAIEREDTLVHHSTYLTVPPQWLGEQFLVEAEHLKEVKPEAYRHEYLGEVTGTGGEVFSNVTLRAITDEEISRFNNLRRGIDWGYAADPFAYNVCHYDKTRRRLYIFREIHKVKLSNRAAADLIKPEAGGARITCDSAEPKSIDEVKGYGLRVVGAKKGPDSVEYGVKWLQDLEEIIIDPARCPETAREFSGYELERDREGNFKAGYPDKDNHHIDAVRYACEDDMRRPGVRVMK